MRLRAGRLPDIDADFACGSCAGTYRARELDRQLWCEECIAAARARGKRVGWWFGGGVAAALAAWIFLVLKPSILIGGWIGVVLAAFWLCSRIGAEFWYGVLRFRRRPG